MAKGTTLLPAIGRVLLSSLFVWSGYMKLMDPAATAQFFARDGVPAPDVVVWVVIVIELAGGLALLLGIMTRWAAALLALWSLLTGFAVHFVAARQGGDPMIAYDNIIHFYKNLAIAGGLLYAVAFGAGALSFDNGSRSR